MNSISTKTPKERCRGPKGGGGWLLRGRGVALAAGRGKSRDRGVGKGHTLAIREGRKWEM